METSLIILNKLIWNLRIDREFMYAEALVAISFCNDTHHNENPVFINVEKISCDLKLDQTSAEISQNILNIAIEKARKNIPLMIARRAVA